MRKQHSPTFKAQVVMEALKEEKTINQLAAEHEIHPVMISQWKSVAVKGLSNLFERGGQAEAELKAAHEKEKEELYGEIGRLHAQIAWMKKKAGRYLE